MSRLPKNRRKSVGVFVVLGLLVSLIVALPHLAGATDQPPSGPPTGTQLCNGGPDASLLVNPASAPPAGAVTVPAGDDSALAMSNGKLVTENFGIDPDTVYWFAAGTHTLGMSNFGQIDPKAGDVFEGAPGAVIDGAGVNQSAFDGTAAGVTIEYLTIEGFVPGTDAIAVNHDSGPSWTIEFNTITDNTGAGVGLGSDDVVNENCLAGNDQYGFNAVSSSPVSSISLTNNDIAANDTNGTYDQSSYVVSYAVASDVATIVTRGPMNLVSGHTILIGAAPACGFSWCTNLSDAALNGPKTVASVLSPHSFTFDVTAPDVSTTADPVATVADSQIDEGAAGGGKFWDIAGGATVTGNWVHSNGYAGLWPDTDNAGFDLSGNYIADNWAEGIIYEASYNAQIADNTFVDNAWGGGPSPALGGFPDAALYISESGSDARVPGPYGARFAVTGNDFTDNWGGVVIYENSNRACGLSNDALCTLVAPSTYTLLSCAANIPNGSTGEVPDYVDNCRWKSQNISVADNTFNFTAADIGPDCTTANTCGYNGLFSDEGTTPSGAWPLGDIYPYGGYTVANNISNHQNNSFANNTYCGAWSFVGFAQGNSMTPSQWTSGESNAAASGDTFQGQDAGSTFAAGACTTASTTTTGATTTTGTSPTTTTGTSPTTTGTSPTTTDTSPATTSPGSTTTAPPPTTTTTTESPPPASPPPPPQFPPGYDLVGQDGGVFCFPTGQFGGFFGSLPGRGISVDDIVGLVPSPDDRGYLLVGQDGGVFAFGDAPFLGSLPGLGISVDDISGILATRDNGGYLLVDRHGGVFAFGDASFQGSLPGRGDVVNDIIGIAASRFGQGYWLVGADGSVYAFGNAAQLGSATGTPSPVAGISATRDGGGYWIVTQDGQVYPFGDAGYFSSLPALGVTPSLPVTGLVPTSDSQGYWLVASDGGIFAFGDAGFVGSPPGIGVHITNIEGAVPVNQ